MQLNNGKLTTFEEHVFATLLDALAIDYYAQVTFYDYWIEHYGVGRVRADFVVYSPICAIFEIDGPIHWTSWRQKRKDRMRDEFLRAQGFKVVRIRNTELFDDDLQAVAARVWALLIGDTDGNVQPLRRRTARPKSRA